MSSVRCSIGSGCEQREKTISAFDERAIVLPKILLHSEPNSWPKLLDGFNQHRAPSPLCLMKPSSIAVMSLLSGLHHLVSLSFKGSPMAMPQPGSAKWPTDPQLMGPCQDKQIETVGPFAPDRDCPCLAFG